LDLTASNPAADPLPSDQVAINPTGQSLVTLDGDNQVYWWTLDLDELIQQSCRTASRNLSWDEWQQSFGKQPYHSTCPDLPPHSSYITHLLDDAATQVKAGKIAIASAAYMSAQKLDPHYLVDAAYWNTLCRAGVLRGQLNTVQAACGRAVAQAPDNAQYRDSRGLARALNGDSTGAIEDFTAYISWAIDAGADTNAATQREQWITTLKAGGQPITDDVLKQLLETEQ
jgi:hypothetical protein